MKSRIDKRLLDYGGGRNLPATLAELETALRAEVAQLGIDAARGRARGFPEDLIRDLLAWQTRFAAIVGRLEKVRTQGERAI